MILRLLFLLALLFSTTASAVNRGVISRIDFSGNKSAWGSPHSNIVQLYIEDGFDNPICQNTKFAAIRTDDDHLISAALAAFMTGKIVSVQLSNTDTYYDGNRCVITDLFIEK